MEDVVSNTIRGVYVSNLNRKDSDWKVNIIKCKKEYIPAEYISKLRAFGNGKYSVTVVGMKLPADDSEYEYTGQWQENKYGMQFKADYFLEAEPASDADMIAYLSSSKFEGIGRATAKAIVEKFGSKTWDVIQNEPEKLAQIKGVKLSRIRTISESFKKSTELRSLIRFLSPFGFGTEKMSSISDKLTVGDLQKNPYLLYEYGFASFNECDRISFALNYPANNANRMSSAINHVLRQDMSRTGNMLMKYSEFENCLMKQLNYSVSLDDCRKAVSNQLSADKAAVLPSYGLICTSYSNYLEYEISKALTDRVAHNNIAPGIKEAYTNAADSYVKKAEVKPTENQIKAVKTALTNRVSVITGGPGTGKTTIIKAIIGSMALADKSLNDKHEIIGLAPTGKARSRMQEVTGIACHTIHSELRLSTDPQPDAHTEVNVMLPNNAIIIIDEMSMVDSRLMKAILDASPEDSSLVLVGDADQLPSVGAGSVLQQIIMSGVVPVVKLTDIFRQGSNKTIIDNAYAVNSGIVSMKADNTFVWVRAADQHQAMIDAVNAYCENARMYGQNETVILTPLRAKGEASAESINTAVQAAVNPAKTGEEVLKVGTTEFRINDKVMQTKNVHNDLTGDNVANGDIGRITDIVTDTTEKGEKKTRVHISFETGVKVEYERSDMKNVSLAYCITIHKSQGSEYKSVIIVMCSSQICPLFSQNLLFTAISRSSEKVTMIGDAEGVKQCILTPNTGRISTLADRMKKRYAEEKKTKQKEPEGQKPKAPFFDASGKKNTLSQKKKIVEVASTKCKNGCLLLIIAVLIWNEITIRH